MKLLSILLLSITCFLMEHNSPIAYFSLYKSTDDAKDVARLDIKMDKYAIMKVLEPDQDRSLDQKASDYLQEHFKLSFDNCESMLVLQDISIDGHHVIFKVLCSHVPEYYESIEIKNTFLLHTISQSNILQLIALTDSQRDFTMNNTRTKIRVTYRL